ncbi:cytochrome c oxidase polypeptide III [Geomicrobium sp. JCM 19055]|nr:cytochrome c oxidase polypeptide III [Geomicrobium sp. JCM 19055]
MPRFFGTYLGLRNGTAGGPEAADLFHMPLVFIMTMILLTSSLTSVIAITAMKKNQFKKMKLWMWITFFSSVLPSLALRFMSSWSMFIMG